MVAMGVSRLDHGRWRIENLEENQAAAGPSSSLVKDLVKNSERVTMVLPGSGVRTSLIKLPKLKKKETNSAVSGWVAREELSPPDEWSVSWRQLPGDSDPAQKDQKDIFLLYAPREDVDRQVDLAGSWGGKPHRMLPDYIILDSMFRRYHQAAEDLSAWNVVFVGKKDHFLCVSTQASLLLMRPLPNDLSEGAEAEEYLQRLATEVDRSIFFARQTEFNPDVQRIVVCGDPDLAGGLIRHLKEETNVPAEYWDVGECFEMEGRKLDSRLILPAMAAALATKKSLYNLLPHQSRTLLGPLAQRRLALAASTAAVAMVPILVAGGFMTTSIQDRYLNQARLQLEQAGIRAEQAAEIYVAQRMLVAREEQITQFSENDPDYAGVLLHLASLTPEQIVFQDLRLKETSDERLVLYLSGESNADTVAEAQQSFLDFQKALKKSTLLVAAGEPRKLIISAEIKDGAELKRVEFSMEYQVQIETQTPSAMAALVAGAER